MLIVTYHAVAAPPSPVCSTAEQLASDLDALVDGGFAFVSLDDCADWLAGTRTLPPRAAVVTFDDGYASVVTKGLPILERHRVPAAVFVIAERIGGDNQWPGQWKSIGRMPLADQAQLRELVAAGIAIGSHTSSHPVLSSLDGEALRLEVSGSADRLEEMLQTPVRHFAYPYGFRTPREVAAVRARYRTAVNAEPRLVAPSSDPYDLNRIDCHDLRLAIRLKCLGEGSLGPYLAVRRAMRQVRRSGERLMGRT